MFKVIFKDDSNVVVIEKNGNIASLTKKGDSIFINDTEISIELAEGLSSIFSTIKNDGDFHNLEPVKGLPTPYSLDRAAEVWKEKYLKFKNSIITDSITDKTIIGVGPSFFYLDDGTNLDYLTASAYWIWKSDSTPVGDEV